MKYDLIHHREPTSYSVCNKVLDQRNANSKQKIKKNHFVDGFKARGRSFTPTQIQKIIQIVECYSNSTRTEISQKVCRALRWRQPNGRLKEVACREVLRKLEYAGIIKLPKPRGLGAIWKNDFNYGGYAGDTSIVASIDFKELNFKLAKTKKEIGLWNTLVKNYHYLHTSRIVGRQLKYTVFFNDMPVACLGWGDAAWNVQCRDEWIGWTSRQIPRRRHLIVNNVRFLILPWIKTPNLASHLLAKCGNLVQYDWNNIYKIEPVLLESFVDIQYYSGVCYKATNWIKLGLSAGYAKVGAYHHNSQKPKALFVYPLTKYFRNRLKGRRK
ncbi:DUF4338 domain-containing protein [Candidatus Peregrinibacteria bacterium]|nr:DUF4338 domain-containing protein [Candidatus Peregrinibacteria bacterium]